MWKLLLILLILVIIYIIYIQKNDEVEPFGELREPIPSDQNITVNETRMTGSEFAGYPHYEPWDDIYRNPSAGYLLDDNNEGKFSYPICSKACCSPQYPPPFEIPIDEWLAKNIDKYVPSRYTCNNSWEDTGCLCMTDKQREYLEGRGNNKHLMGEYPIPNISTNV
jgi:hypothetical protein